MAYSTTKVQKENKRKIKNKGKGQGNEVSSDNSPARNAPCDASLPRDNTPLPRHVSLPRESLLLTLTKTICQLVMLYVTPYYLGMFHSS